MTIAAPRAPLPIVLRTRSAVVKRCAWCHDGAELPGSCCSGCRTWLHAACWAEAAQACPTRGCPAQRRVAAEAHTRRAPEWMNLAALAALLLFLGLPLLSGVISLFTRSSDLDPRWRAGKIDSDITARINAGSQ